MRKWGFLLLALLFVPIVAAIGVFAMGARQVSRGEGRLHDHVAQLADTPRRPIVTLPLRGVPEPRMASEPYGDRLVRARDSLRPPPVRPSSSSLAERRTPSPSPSSRLRPL